VGLLAGVKGDAQALRGARWGDTLALGGVELRGGYGALDVDGNVHALGTFAPLGVRPGYTGVLRLGYRGGPLAVRGGAVVQWTPSHVSPLQWLPSLHAGYSFGRFGLSAGVFDGLGYAPAHVSAHLDGFSVGWVVPLGLRAGASLPVAPGVGLRVEGFAFALGSYQSALLTLSATFGPGAGSAVEDRAP
jgi:hypothetical protein